MKTIEERAGDIYDLPDGMPLGVKATIAKEAYIKGATEQKNIDVDKACTEVEDLLYQCKRLGIHSIPQLLLKFRKAIEQ